VAVEVAVVVSHSVAARLCTVAPDDAAIMKFSLSSCDYNLKCALRLFKGCYFNIVQ
jgi:hypothetical protein